MYRMLTAWAIAVLTAGAAGLARQAQQLTCCVQGRVQERHLA